MNIELNKFRLSSDIMESRRTYSTEGSSLHPQLGSIRVHQRRRGSAYSRNGSTRSSAGSDKSLTGSGKSLVGSGKSLTGSGTSLTGSRKPRSGSIKSQSGSGKVRSGSGISGVGSNWLTGENAGIPFVVTSKARDRDSFFSLKKYDSFSCLFSKNLKSTTFFERIPSFGFNFRLM
jgi:hypothetical protein